MPENGQQSEEADGAEPQNHNRAEHLADDRGAMPLHEKKPDQDQAGQWNDVSGRGIGSHIEPFNGRKHGNGRSNDPVTVQEGGARGTQHSEHCPSFPIFFQRSLQAGKERKDTAFAFVVGLHDENNILQTNHKHQRPEDQRKDAENIDWRGRDAMAAGKALLDGVQRAGADIAINNPQGGQSKMRDGCIGLVALIFRKGCCRFCTQAHKGRSRGCVCNYLASVRLRAASRERINQMMPTIARTTITIST